MGHLLTTYLAGVESRCTIMGGNRLLGIVFVSREDVEDKWRTVGKRAWVQYVNPPQTVGDPDWVGMENRGKKMVGMRLWRNGFVSRGSGR